MSFFIRGKPRTAPKRKFDKSKPEKKEKIKKVSKNNEEEEIHSDEEEKLSKKATEFSFEDEDYIETPQDKRLRLAKQYLNDIEEAEKSKADDEEIHGQISQRLKEDYLESIGKLHKEVAQSYTNFYIENAEILKCKNQKLAITCTCLSENDKFLFVGNKNGIIVKWDLSRKQRIAITKSQKNAIQCMDMSFDGKYLAVADGSKNIQILNAENLALIKELEGHYDQVTSLVFRKNTLQLYSASKDRTIKVWSLTDMAYVETLYGHQAPITSIDALNKERAISSGGNDLSIRIWKIIEESQLVYEGHSQSIEIVKLISDDSFLSCGSDGSICVWNTGKKKPLCYVKLAHGKTSNGEANWISSIASLVNTDLIASGSCDGYVRVWKLINKNKGIEMLFEIPVEGFINSLQFTNDGTKLIIGVGQEHRLGRWWRLKEAKNHTIIVPFEINTTK